ncbi:MAG: hypothetical protein ACREJD_05060 [Phycisphaerales bacterium]
MSPTYIRKTLKWTATASLPLVFLVWMSERIGSLYWFSASGRRVKIGHATIRINPQPEQSGLKLPSAGISYVNHVPSAGK